MDGKQTSGAKWFAKMLGGTALGSAVLGAGLCAGGLCTSALAQQTGPRLPVAPVKPATKANPNNPAATRAGAKAINTKELSVMAVVNGDQITRPQLGQECLKRYGGEVLESMINRALIAQACQESGIQITNREVDQEVAKTAQKFGLTVENWITLLKDERGIAIEQYRDEIIWPTIALRRLAADQIEVTKDELRKAFETDYGPRVRVRVIGTSKEKVAREALAKAKANPGEFAELAKKYCEDPNIASVGGSIPPVRRHLGDASLEKVAFSMKPGQVSDVIKVQNQYFVLFCEGQDPERYIDPKVLPDVEANLTERIRDTKLRTASTDLFTELQKKSQVKNGYVNKALQEVEPGVAATIDGQPITTAELKDKCIARHGISVLEGEINRKLLNQELTKKNLMVSQEDIDEEVARAAVMYGCVNKDGSANIDEWLKKVQEQDGATIELYIRDAVWPSVALKKLCREGVRITQEDLQKGFESNYGPRVDVLAIVLSDQRMAQRVWDMARTNDSDEYFGKLAAEYSIEPVSKGNSGKVPPIRKWGGQPAVEEVAFKLKKGELSSLITVADKTIILRCLGQTKPVVTKLSEVRGELEADLLEKKLTAEMTKTFDRIRTTAQIDNFLVGTSQAARSAVPALGSKDDEPKAPSARVGSRPKSGK